MTCRADKNGMGGAVDLESLLLGTDVTREQCARFAFREPVRVFQEL